MPRDYSERHEREESPDVSESDEVHEKDEIQKRVREIVEEADADLEHEASAEHVPGEPHRELEETGSDADRVEEIVDEAESELRGIEEELGEKLEDVREELHEKFVNDMESQLDGPSLKETKEESAEAESDSESSETTESSESYIEAADGMVYVIETGSETEGQTKNEVETETDEAAEEERSETLQVPEEAAEESESEASEKLRNSIVRPECVEVEESEETVSPIEIPENQERPENTEKANLEDYAEYYADEAGVERLDVPSENEENGLHPEEVAEKAAEQGEDSSPEYVESIPESQEVTVEENTEDAEEVLETSPEVEDIGTKEFSEPEESTQEFVEVSEEEEDIEESIEVPDDIMHKIEQLLEELSESEEEEVDESRVIIDAMTGEKSIDHSLEPQPYFSETEEDLEREEEEQLRERLRELFEMLTEEEREQFKESVRPEIESEEELEELVRRWRSKVISPDLKQHLEDARRYVRSKRKGETPRLIRELRALEVERAWSLAVREAVRRLLERGPSRTLSPRSRQQVRKKKKRKTGYHKGREHAIKLHQPLMGKRPAGSFESYRKWLERNYPGLCEGSDYPELLEQLRKFFELRAALKGRKAIRQFEVDEIGVRLGLKKSTAREWALMGHIPHMIQIVGSAMSQREAVRLRKHILKKAGGIGEWSVLERRLRTIYPDRAYTRVAQYSSKAERVREFFDFLRKLERGGTQKGIARRSGISVRRVRAFTDGEIPWLIRHLLQQEGRLAPSKRYGHHLTSTYRVKIRSPKIRGREVRSYAAFERLVERNFPWLKERSDYERLMRVARAYFDAQRKFSGQSHVTRNELVAFVKLYRLSVEAAADWFKGKSLPMVFNMLENALTVTEAKRELKKILGRLNGVTSLAEYNRRMKTFYLLPEMKALQNYKKEYGLVKEFFRFLKALEKGGLYTDIIKRGRLTMGNTKRRRLYSGFPRLVNIALSIPSNPPKSGHKWLPMVVTKKFEPAGFIEAAARISKPSDLEMFLKEFVRKQRQLTKEESETNQLVNEFMYLLGLLASDGSFNKKDGFSSRVCLKLSKKYEWSVRVGTAFCRALQRFGIRATRGKDSTTRLRNGTVVNLMNWHSQNKPLFHWMRRSLLGQKPGPKRRLKISWVLKMPTQERTSYIQGVADGDGHASVRALRAGIASKYNKKLLGSILTSLGIESTNSTNGLVIHRKRALKIASELPLFRHADGRLFRLREICEMVAAMKHAKVSDQERKQILKYYRKGFKPMQITALLWAEYGSARRFNTIQKVIGDADLRAVDEHPN